MTMLLTEIARNGETSTFVLKDNVCRIVFDLWIADLLEKNKTRHFLRY